MSLNKPIPNRLDVRPSGSGISACVDGIDLARLDQPTADRLKIALGDYGVLFFRNQDLTIDQHLAVAERFGSINVNRFLAHVSGEPRVAEVRKEPDQRTNIGAGWHTDHSYDQIPAMGSILLARETPSQGGDTIFSNMYEAYATLSDGLKATLRGLNALHSSRHVFGKSSQHKAQNPELERRYGNEHLATQDAVHPVVIRHPVSRRQALYVNASFTQRFEGWTEAESKPLLEFLYQHGAREEFTYRFQWAKGSIAFWDNRATWHRAINDYHGHRRLMHRVTLEGSEIGR